MNIDLKIIIGILLLIIYTKCIIRIAEIKTIKRIIKVKEILGTKYEELFKEFERNTKK